jgi:hypothetical protein
MPATSTVTIAAEQREAIYGYVHDRLSALGDVWKSIEREDYATAERVGGEFRQDFHLLDALGWQPQDERDEFSLTLPVDDLASLLIRLREDAIGAVSETPEQRETTEAEERFKARSHLIRETCEGLLRELNPREGD